MEEGLIYTKDKEEIGVFFLKAQAGSLIKCSEWQEHPTEPNTWIVDEETAKALDEDNKDCCEELKQEYASCCPVGHEGESGEVGLFEEEFVIKRVLDQFKDTQLNIASEQARIFLAREIAKDLRVGGFFKKEHTQF